MRDSGVREDSAPIDFTVGQGLLAGSATPIILPGYSDPDGMSPLSSSPAKSSPMAPRIRRESPPTKQPSDQAPGAEDFNIKSLISPVEVNDDSPQAYGPTVVIERCETMIEETHRDSQPSSHSQAESSNTFGFHMRQVSCKSSASGRGLTPESIRSPSGDSAGSPGFTLAPMAIPDANSADSVDEAVSERSCKRRDRRSRRNRTTSATNTARAKKSARPSQEDSKGVLLAPPEAADPATKRLVNIEVCVPKEPE